jgi:4-carboxymuconolactone decarboxylase
MSDKIKELAIILVARDWNSDIEWTGHALLAARGGVSDQTIEGIRTHDLKCLPEDEKMIASFVQELLRQKEVSDDVFSEVHRMLGDEGIVDLTLTVCYYTAVSLAQIALRPEMEEGRVSTL